MRTRWLAVVIGFAVLLSTAAFGSVVLTPAYPGAAASLAYKISVDGQPVFVHRFPTFNQFQWMDYGSITMTGKVHVTITSLVNDRNVIACSIHPLAFGTDLHTHLLAYKGKPVAKFHEEHPQIAEQSGLQVGLAVPFGQVEEVEQVAVPKDARRILG